MTPKAQLSKRKYANEYAQYLAETKGVMCVSYETFYARIIRAKKRNKSVFRSDKELLKIYLDKEVEYQKEIYETKEAIRELVRERQELENKLHNTTKENDILNKRITEIRTQKSELYDDCVLYMRRKNIYRNIIFLLSIGLLLILAQDLSLYFPIIK